jgi:4-amino-4-deoxy-L-arabinose transferase-like glycosyltransferase
MTATQPVQLESAVARRSALPGLVLAGFLAAIVFCITAPTLDWMQFCYGVEKLNIATALEIRRGSPWLIPTLEGEPRVRKPPLTAWITAAAIDPATVQALSSLDPATREKACLDLAWQVRWPALLSACLMLVGIYELGQTLVDARTGLLALLVAATSFYFVRFTRQTLTDIPLSLWVTVANVFLAKAIFDRRLFTGCLAGGAAIGLALMSKGPVALVQSIAPLLIFLLWRTGSLSLRERVPAQTSLLGSPRSPHPARLPAAIGLGILVMLLVGASWFAWIYWQMPEVRALWFKEVARTDEVERASSRWYDYISLLPHLLPWTVFFIGGVIEGVRACCGDASWFDRVHAVPNPTGRGAPPALEASGEHGRPASRSAGTSPSERSRQGLILALLLLLVPVLIMSCFRDRKDRYLLPLLGPGAILIAASLRAFLALPRVRGIDKFAEILHWAILVTVGVGLPLLGATTWLDDMRTWDGRAWFSPALAAATVALALLVILTGLYHQSRRRWAFVAATVVLVLAGQTLFCFGQALTPQGRSEMKPLADYLWQHHPDALVYNLRGDGRRKMTPQDLSIYLNRPTRIYDTVDMIPPSDHPQIYTELWEGGHPQPPPAAGWTFLFKTPRNQADWWVAFIRRPTQPGAS